MTRHYNKRPVVTLADLGVSSADANLVSIAMGVADDEHNVLVNQHIIRDVIHWADSTPNCFKMEDGRDLKITLIQLIDRLETAAVGWLVINPKGKWVNT